MVPGPEAVVNEGAVVIVVIGAPVADGAVERVFRLYHLVEDAQVVQVDVLLQEIVNQPNEVEFSLQVPWFNKNRSKERHKRNYEKHDAQGNAYLLLDRCFLDIVDETKTKGQQDDQVRDQAHTDDQRGALDFADRTVPLEAHALLVVAEYEFQTLVLGSIERIPVLF